jgi:hypothetical protein
VELRGQFSNPSARDKVDLGEVSLSRSGPAKEVHDPALHGPRRPCTREVVDVDKLVQRFVAGEIIKNLAKEYATSESSVKRLLRARQVRRRLSM